MTTSYRLFGPPLLLLSACESLASLQPLTTDIDSGRREAATASPASPSDAGRIDAAPDDGGGTTRPQGKDAARSADTSADAARATPLPYSTSVITTTHRFVPTSPAGAMFGGWGPHLGHLFARSGDAGVDEVWLADDACTQDTSSPDVCDVNIDRRIDYRVLGASGWTDVGSLALIDGVQQNTGTVLQGNTLFSYGVGTTDGQLVECSAVLPDGVRSATCNELALSTGTGDNYVGAALSPEGYRLAWLTDVVNDGGGSLNFYVNYGAGWNGPRSGTAGGYNDASYINIGFYTGSRAGQFVMHGELVSGVAPNWTFLGAVGTANLDEAAPVVWQNALGIQGDSVESTDDVTVDPNTNDTHLLARTYAGSAAYYFEASGGSWGAPSSVIPDAYRARWVWAPDGTLYLFFGPSGAGLAYKAAPPSVRVAGMPVDWDSLPTYTVPLPPGCEDLLAIYPAAPVYQSTIPRHIHLAIVGSVAQNELLYVGLTPP